MLSVCTVLSKQKASACVRGEERQDNSFTHVYPLLASRLHIGAETSVAVTDENIGSNFAVTPPSPAPTSKREAGPQKATSGEACGQAMIEGMKEETPLLPVRATVGKRALAWADDRVNISPPDTRV